MKVAYKAYLSAIKDYAVTFFKWLAVAGVTGVITGVVGSFFSITIQRATVFRQAHSFIILFLPLGGIAIVALYRLLRLSDRTGTNLILSSVRANKRIPLALVPAIFIASAITHFLGGSAGREGAALQLGGDIGFNIGKLFRLDRKDMSLVVICGMAGLFSALFGTPVTAAFFAMEVISVGVIYYSALVPGLISAMTAYAISLAFRIPPERFDITGLPKFSLADIARITALSAMTAVISIIFCMMMRHGPGVIHKFIKNHYLKAFVGGLAIVALTFGLRTFDYNGAGMDIVGKALEGSARPEAFLLKMVFTCITIGCGFKGGEIVPSFFIGATFGCVAGGLLGLDPSFAAAVGLVAMFCGVVNCPIASMILSVELFGTEGILFFALACGISYMLSGYYGLYSSQKIVYSKLRPEYINTKTK